MGTVTVTGRDELGRIIDVTLTTNADVPPPGPEVVPEGGGGGVPDPAEAPDGQVPTTADGAYELASVAVSDIQSVSRSLSSAEVLSCGTTPIIVVAGVPGRIYMPVGFYSVYRAGLTPYAGNLVAYVQPRTSTLGINVAATIGDAADQINGYSGSAPPGPEPTSVADGQDLLFVTFEGDPVDGDGTLDITVLYRVVDVS